jgi:hypothetical protein
VERLPAMNWISSIKRMSTLRYFCLKLNIIIFYLDHKAGSRLLPGANMQTIIVLPSLYYSTYFADELQARAWS